MANCGCNGQSQTVITDNTNVLMFRVRTADATYLLQADISSIRVDVYDIDENDRTAVDLSGEEITDGSAADEPTAAQIVFDTLQTDARWTKDGIGYNVAYSFEAPLINKRYDVRITMELASGDVIVLRPEKELLSI